MVPEESVPLEEWSDDRGEIAFRTVVGDGERPTDSLTAGVAVLQPGGWLGHHRHDPAEVYHVLEGRATVVLDGVAHEVGPGDTVFVPGGSEHGVRNTGHARLRVFYTLAVDAFTDVEYRFSDGSGPQPAA